MLDRLNPIPIAKSYVSPFGGDDDAQSVRRCDWAHVFMFLVAPAVLGLATWLFLGELSGKVEDISLYIATVSILAAVMTGLLPIVHGVLGQTQVINYTPLDEKSRKAELRRVETLRELYSAICFSVISLVFGILFLLALAFAEAMLPSMRWIRSAFSIFIYIISGIAIAAFLNIATGVYAALEHQADGVTSKLIASKKRLIPPPLDDLDDSPQSESRQGSPE